MRKANPVGAKLIRFVRGLALPEYFMPIVTRGVIVGYCAKAIIAGDALRVDYLPGYLELVCSDVDTVLKVAREQGLKVYRGKKHVTISDTVYKVRILLDKQIPEKTITKKINGYTIHVAYSVH
ncbi:MAG: hypothetical protein DRJ52_03570 [Thermoprotei archaeon]|nr:MAG: hypothetical protein DRJ52_03570 [Thermoprotei archaeon]RLE98984.1 MAG: hypothetical protein DRJ63_06620 [Thermoprotei archaeon]HDI75591.1 hypothetical protein [Thermoprotei archaeon]